MSIEAPPPTWIRTVKFLGLPLLVFVLLQADSYYPFVRFTNAFADVAVGTLSFLLPFLAAFFALIIPRRWLTTVIALALLSPLLCLSAVGLLLGSLSIADAFRTGSDASFERIASAPMVGYSVGIYRTNCGAPCSYGIQPLQEKQIIPGIVLVRALPGFDQAGEATCKVIGQDTLLINVPPYVDDYHPSESIPARSRTYHLKPFLYF
jgi:hypothetical protein